MRPKITCHMITSLDGRLHPDRWSDAADAAIDELVARNYDAAAGRLGAGGWIVGRKTMADFVDQTDMPDLLDEPRARPPYIAERAGRDLAIAIDPSARLRFASDDVDGDHAVAVVSERASDDALARLRANGVSYVFAGADGRQLDTALDALGDLFCVEHLLLEGGGATNGAFLAAGLIDAVSTLICPAIDGLAGVPAIFEHAGPPRSRPAQGQHLRLSACETLEGGVIWLRHDVVRA